MTDGLCYLEFSDGAYFSSDALYLTQVDYDSPSDSYRTYLHKFDLGNTLAYAGSGRVEGALFLGGQSDFRISGAADYVRLVTTRYTGDDADRLDHSLFVLQADPREKNSIPWVRSSTTRVVMKSANLMRIYMVSDSLVVARAWLPLSVQIRFTPSI